jgi:hypothetical protein
MLTRHRLGPNFVHETWCCGIHEDDLENPIIECVDLAWMLHATSTRTVFVDGVVATPGPFFVEAQRFVPVDTTKWTRLDAEEETPDALL